MLSELADIRPLSGRNAHGSLAQSQLADQWRRRLRRFDNADTLPSPVLSSGGNAQSQSFYQWRRNFQTDQQETLVATFYIAVDLDARAGGGNCRTGRAAMIQIEFAPAVRMRSLGRGCRGRAFCTPRSPRFVQATNTGECNHDSQSLQEIALVVLHATHRHAKKFQMVLSGS